MMFRFYPFFPGHVFEDNFGFPLASLLLLRESLQHFRKSEQIRDKDNFVEFTYSGDENNKSKHGNIIIKDLDEDKGSSASLKRKYQQSGAINRACYDNKFDVVDIPRKQSKTKHHKERGKSPESRAGSTIPPSLLSDETDLKSVDKGEMFCDQVINDFLKIKTYHMADVACVSTHFYETLRRDGWQHVRRRFHFTNNNDSESNTAKFDIRRSNRKRIPLDSPVLVFPVFTRSRTNGHWTLLIRDSRGVGHQNATWRYFDTLNCPSRAEGIKRSIQNIDDLWMNGMEWQTVKTPNQVDVDCGPWVCMLAESYLEWTANMASHKWLNCRQIGVLSYLGAAEFGSIARDYIRDAITARENQERDDIDILLQPKKSISFKILPEQPYYL